MTDNLPSFKSKAFNCPHCNTYSHMDIERLYQQGATSKYMQFTCSHCGDHSLWRITRYVINVPDDGVMIYPDSGGFPHPSPDMPEDVALDYLEAAEIANKSPRGAAALLRLALQKLCKHLGESGENINKDIRSLASKGILSNRVINVADTIRLTGNNAVHPGEMSEEDIDEVSLKLFDLLNYIVRYAITEPKELEALYLKTPATKRKAAEEHDSKAIHPPTKS
ncbi:DUF4145 domain-containing protein [Pseudoalteromonas elyakovii]|nr:DUF4145 domain-containing protein [Pseudoalteromonas elyakovii]